MELLHKFKQNGYFTSELYHLLAKKKMVSCSEPIIPSEYIKEISMSTQERLQHLNAIELDNIVRNKDRDKVVLSFTPRILIFQNFKPNDKITAKFSVKNISKAPTFLNMVYKESSYFSIRPYSGQLLSRLAPGISVSFLITFTPIQFEDYVHRVTFYTDTDQYVLALIAFGPRPIFDFPDILTLPDTPLKVESNTLLTIHNMGVIPAGFTLNTKCPFSVHPKSAYLNPKEKVELKIGFKTMYFGESCGAFYAVFETGETFIIKTLGKTHGASVELEKPVVRFLDTFNTMVRQLSFKITNKSEQVLTYMCMKNDCLYNDFEEKIKLATIFYELKESEAAKNMKLVQYDVVSSDEHERVYTRIFFDEIQSLVADESLQFQDTHFSVTPIKGKLWPKKPTEITITFAPKEIGEFTATAFLDIDGVSNRIPLKFVGTSLPPLIQLNLETLDMNCVYINKTYNYEIVAINKGHINGVILYREVPTLFGSRITCSPEMHCLRPGEKEIFVITFCNSNQGPYFEEINFVIRDTKVVLKVYLKGEVIYPSLMFSIPCLDFGMVSLGVPETREVDVINESIVDVSASVKISSDGPEISSITLEDYAFAESPKPQIPPWPREFNIEPRKIDIGPETRISIKVTLTANLIRANQTALELELEKSDSPPIVLPVMYNAMVPQITRAPDIKLRACFIDFPYKNEINIVSNEFWGYFTLDEFDDSHGTFEVDVEIKEGLIKPNSSISLPVTFKTGVLGVHDSSIRIKLFGLSKSLEICRITGVGVRPIVTCTPIALHWGQVKLLTKSQKTLTLCNDSPVYVNFKALLLNKDGRWNISPTEGFIEPESETDLILTLYMIDADTYTNKAVIQLEKVKDILVPLSATGIGTSILVGDLRDKIFLGRNFTKIPLDRKVIMENCGTRLHSLEWIEHYKAPKTKPHTASFFNLDPRQFKIAAGEKFELTITGLSYKVTTITEVWYLVGSVEGINKKELLLECPIVAEFVDPKIELSSSVIDLQYDYGPYSEYYKLTDIITIKNVSKLPLDIDLSVKPPFAIIQKQNTYKILPQDEHMCCCISYNECDLNVSNIINEVGVQQSKTFIDYLTLNPVEPLRKGRLHFFQDINKIKMAFNLTHVIEERLQDQDVMKLQILLDTTKHLSLKSRVYCDLMRIKFKGHKNKDAIKLIGKINFPNMLVLSPRVDFQCILNGCIESKTIKIQNITPLLVCYRFQWKKCIITSITMPPPALKIDLSRGLSETTISPEEIEREEVGQSKFFDSKISRVDTEVVNDIIYSPMRQVSPATPEPCYEEELIKPMDSEEKFNLLKTQLIRKIAPMLDLDYETKFEWTHKFSIIEKYMGINVNEVIQVAPHRGLLKPNEIQYIQVIFQPKANINVRGILECEVLGGPSETIIVTGQSSDLMYKIDTQKLNYKIRSFHENATESIYISNIAQLPFEYKTYLDEPLFENELEGTILDLMPPEKILETEEEAELKIVMRPGVVGYFHRVFLLEIGHFPHIPIEVFGWGVVPQVYLNLPRPEIALLPEQLGYEAIPLLTSEYMLAIAEIFNRSESRHLISPMTDKCMEDADLQRGWHICSSWDDVPSTMDIELAIERMLVINHIKNRPDIFAAYSSSSKMNAIPGFHTTPYVIDYGVIITGSTVQCTVDIINYGPIATKLHFAKGTHVPTWLGMKLCGKLNPGETGKLEVVFSPTSEYFTELEQNMETCFNLEVPYGVTIPIQIKALCAVPYLMSNVKEINFGSIRCGNKVICSIPLKNVGKPTCIWYVTLRLKAPGHNPMMILDSAGKYEPGEGGWLSVAFKPTLEMSYEGLLIFRFHMNPNRMTIPVSGQGIIPQVHIIGPNVNFPPTLPWSETTEIFFGLTNPCPFPIELIIAHTDENWKEEEEIFQLLYKYYNKPEEMLVPAIIPGHGLPQVVKNFYRTFKQKVKKALDDELAASKTMNARANAASKKSAKSPKTAKAAAGIIKEVSPRRIRNEAEIIADEMKILKENSVDPLKESLSVFDRLSTVTTEVVDKRAKGIIIVFHGSPCEEIICEEIAYSVGKKLKIPTLNIDFCIVEALCTSKTPAKTLLVDAINESYEIAKRNMRPDDSTEDLEETLYDDIEDEFSTILKKMEFLANNRNAATPRSKASDKKKKKTSATSVSSHTALAAMGSTTMFQMMLVEELLTDFFSHPKFNYGFVIDSLNSMVMKFPNLVLTTILKCKPIWNVHLVLGQSDFTKWVQGYEEAQRENDQADESAPKVYEDEEIDEIIRFFEEMDEEEYEQAPADLKSIYIMYGLEARRKKHCEKFGYTSEILRKDKDHSRSLLQVDRSESKKKVKKEETKGKPTNEYLAMNAKYNEYTKNTYESLIQIANNWIFEECDLGSPLVGLNGQVVGATQKKNKKKSDVQLQMSEVDVSDRGFHLTLVMYPTLQYKEAIVNMFVRSPLVQEALKIEEEFDILKCPVKTKEFTVLLPKVFPTINHEDPLTWQYLDELPIKKCECNQLTDLHLLDDTTQDNVINILSKWNCTCGKKVTSSQTSTSGFPSASIDIVADEESEEEIFYPAPLPLHQLRPMKTTNGRLILEPGDLVRCKYEFNPRLEGIFSVKRFVEVSGWPDSRVDINVQGICDLPRIDSRPKKMFDNFVRRTTEDVVYKISYLDDQKLFEFGPIFVGDNRIYEEEYTMDLKNSSLTTANIVIEFLEETTVFQIDKDFIVLEPGCKGKLTISAAPVVLDVHRSVLLFCIKDNPEIVTVTIGCSGVVPIVEILPVSKYIEYGKLLLYRREDDRFIVKNDSILPIMWKIRNTQDFLEDFIISKSTGIVPGHDNQVVPVTYIACRVNVITHRALTIDIYDELGRGDPMIIDTLYLSAECYDVMVDCAYENPAESFLNYGNVKVNSNVVREMYLLNRGKYNIYYKLKKVKNFPEPSLLRSFEAIPECGVLPPAQKLVCIEFYCTPTTSMNLVNVPAYTCSLLDDSKEQVVVAKFPVCVTIASFYNTFTLFPLGELNFHIIAVGSGVMREVILNNTSKCPVTYEIIVPEEYRVDPEYLQQHPPKGKEAKIKNPPLRCGNFLILNEDNLLAPGTSRTIQIQFLATSAKTFQETIHFVISDTCPAEAQGVPLKLVGTGAMPVLDFWNVETTFREHLIVKNLNEYKVHECSPHCVFVENSATLYFFSVNVNTSYTAIIDLYNNGLVPCALTMNLHYQSNSNSEIFSLDKYEAHIEPLLHKNLGIIFTPKALEEYRAVLEIRLKLLDYQEQSFKICLIGEGVIPRVRLITPVVRQHRIALLTFPVTCLGSVSNKIIRVKNISAVKSIITFEVLQTTNEQRSIFWLNTAENCDHMVLFGRKDYENRRMQIAVKPEEIVTLTVSYNPLKRGKTSCDVKITILENPYEYFNILCEAEAFMEDVILIGLEMLPMDIDLDVYKSSTEGTSSTASTIDGRKKSRSAPLDKKKALIGPKKKKVSVGSMKTSESSGEPSVLKYILNFGGCEISAIQKRSVIMVNNSEKVYKFSWVDVENVLIKPSTGYISPGEEKDLEIMFFAAKLITISKEVLVCNLTVMNDDYMTMDLKGMTWDNRQVVTLFEQKQDVNYKERCEVVVDEQAVAQNEATLITNSILVLYSAMTQYTKYRCSLKDEMVLSDTFIYQTRSFKFNVQNVGNVPMKIVWEFTIDDEFPARIDKCDKKELDSGLRRDIEEASINDANEESKKDLSKVTLFSKSSGRQSVDTWFEVNLPFTINPSKDCLKPYESRTFVITFAPLNAFNYNVRLKSFIDNLDPYDQNISCKILAKSLIPYVHLDIEESDYLTSGRRKVTGIALPSNMTVLEFNVLGWGCYKKTFNVINPTDQGYEFVFEMVMSDKPELVPVHCNMLKGYVEGGTSAEVTFTFSPIAPGVYESQWKFLISEHNISLNLLVVGLVREPEIVFVPTILIIRNSLVGFTTTNIVMIKNSESEGLKFEFKGNSLCNESGKTPVIVEPENGILKPNAETPIKIIYTPIQDGPLSFKIFCSITFMTKYLTLCVNALSHSIKPTVIYYIIGNEHILSSDAITNIHLEQTASTYERKIPFKIKNDGSATFFFDWNYSCSAVKKYLQVYIEPRTGHVAPGQEAECTLFFKLKQVPVQAFPVTLFISDGPEYTIYLHANIEKPDYHFSCTRYDFGKCFINAPDTTYKKNLAFFNDDKVPITVDLNFENVPELFVDYHEVPSIPPKKRYKIAIFFRPKQIREYEFTLQFWVNSLCEENIIIKGEGIPLLFDLYEGCQKSFDLGPVKVGEKIVRTIEVMNYSKVAIDASFIFRDMYPTIGDTTDSEATSVCLDPSEAKPSETGPSRATMLQNYKDNKVKQQIAMDVQNALSSLKVVPARCHIQPYRKAPLKIQFKPVGLISTLDVQLNMKVLSFERPLVKLSGSATGMSLCFSQNSLQFGRVRKKGCKILKVMLLNKGDFGARFWWQPLISDEFKISPQHGHIAAHTNVTFTITFRPNNHNPFIKVWASCNIENYQPLELAMYATCVDAGTVQNKTMYLECPVRETVTDYVVVTNPSDDMWLVLSEVSGGPFDTLREFTVEPNSVFEIPVNFRPKSIGKHEAQVLYSPLGESALFVTLVGSADHPNPNGDIKISVPAKHTHTQDLLVYNITESPETYIISSEVVRTIPDKFDGYYEIKHPDTVKVWGEAAATCRWKIVCYEECEITVKVLFINIETREYQFYNIVVTVVPCDIVDTIHFSCRAREISQKELVIKNSLSTEADYLLKCEKLHTPAYVTIGRNSEVTIMLKYAPLVVGSIEDYLEVYNAIAGTYTYKIIMTCLPAKEKDIEVSTPLGTRTPLRLKAQNQTDLKAEFRTMVSHPCIQADFFYSLEPLEKGKFLVWFEPTDLGVQNCSVSFDSIVAGEFIYNIKGFGNEPKPQGPYEIKLGGSTTISFKNIFEESRTFKIYVDSEHFYVKMLYETIKSKSEIKIDVFLSDMSVTNAIDLPTGSLTVESYDPSSPKVTWTYFLQGVF